MSLYPHRGFSPSLSVSAVPTPLQYVVSHAATRVNIFCSLFCDVTFQNLLPPPRLLYADINSHYSCVSIPSSSSLLSNASFLQSVIHYPIARHSTFNSYRVLSRSKGMTIQQRIEGGDLHKYGRHASHCCQPTGRF